MDQWSKGDHPRRIPEASMVVEELPEINPPFGRVPGQELLAISRLESRRRWNSGLFRGTEASSRVSGTRDKYRPKGALGVAPWPRRPEGAPPRACVGPPRREEGGGPPPALLRDSGVFCNKTFLGFILE